MKKIIFICICVVILVFVMYKKQPKPPSTFLYTFSTTERFEESGSIEESPGPYFWLDSGGYMDIGDGVGKTAQGEVPANNKWRMEYALTNPVDTDNGLHPQNIFRLISKEKWKNFREEAYFKIIKDNLSNSPSRDESNGLLLFMRYVDSNNLYYVGLRVDGNAVVKKKVDGVYYVLDQKPVFSGKAYNRTMAPNLLPKNTWIGIRGEIINVGKNVSIKVYTDVGKTGTWKLAAEAIDDGVQNNDAIKSAGYVGIRTDFMDVVFDDFKVENL